MTDGLDEVIDEQGGHMKSTYGWYGGNNGTNSSGFSGLPGGYRYHINGGFYDTGHHGSWWSSSPSGSSAWVRNLVYYNDQLYRYDFDLQRGASVRCVRDAE